MKIYYEERKKNDSYDTTVDATIVDISRKPDGIYRVRTDNAEFEAYSISGDYYKNDNVLVQIPNGDYKNQKFILGRKADESAEVQQIFNFKLPFDDFIGLRHLNRNETIPSGKYWANYPSYREELPKVKQSKNKKGTLVWSWKNTGGSTIGNTRLGIECDWTVLLGHFQPLRGTYGFKIVITGLDSATEKRGSQTIERIHYFTNRDMYGNTYAFYSPYTQQKVIDITDFLNIYTIDVYFYQDYDFVDGDNNTIVYTDYDEKTGQPLIPENISFENTNIYLGISAEDIKDETILLYSYDKLGYTGIEEKVEDKDGDMLPTGRWLCDENHELRMVWVHYEKDGTFSVIDTLDELLKQERTSGKDTHIYWYRRGYDEEIKAKPEELFFPGQKYKKVNGEYIPETDSVTGYPLFESSSNELIKEQRAQYQILAKDLMDSEQNPDYESRIERYGGEGWTFIPGMTDSFVQNVIPRGEKSREKFKVVIQHHGTHTTSVELVLKNSRDVEAELAGGARNDAIIIKSFKLKKKKDEDNEWINGEYEIIEDGALNAFYVYDENNNILVNDDNERFDAHEYYLQIHARNDDTGGYELLEVKDEYGQSTGTLISWAFPHSYSMIRSVLEVTRDDAKYFGINPDLEPLRFENFRNATMKFTIEPILNNRYLDNTVGAVIRKNEQEYHIEKALQFGRAQSLGHEFLPILEIIYPVGGTYLCNSGSAEFQIGCTVYRKDGTPFETPQTLTFSWRELSGGKAKFFNYGKDYKQETQSNGYLIGEYHHREDSENSGEIGTLGTQLQTHYREKYKKYKGNVVYGFLSSTSAPPIFEVTVYGAADYPLTVRKGFMICNNHNYKQPRDIMIPDRVEFKSDGANPIYYTNNFEVIYTNTYDNGTKIERLIEYPQWKINNTSILQLQSSSVTRSTLEKNGSGNISPQTIENRQYRLDFVTKGTPQWEDKYLEPASYTYISYSTDNGKVAQAIAFDRNTYSSSLVNEWDGTSLTWDEENGAMLSTMIAAGTKDASNRFTGVMMGDWHAKGDESLDVPGLYGYDKGAQAFGFKTDGSAFLGKSGRGRIEFNGNNALISNAGKTCYINLNPINRDLSLYDENQGYSENFIYCEMPTKENSIFGDTDNGILSPTCWAAQYFKDTKNDYFIVNPSYGVFTSGGVIARYGAIGNWMISDQGLYQKASGKYMYLGYNPDTEAADSITYAIYAGTDFGGTGTPTYNSGINPNFSVTWDGTLFARKGLIANTWTIDDTSLSYRVLTSGKNYDKIYIGKPEANTGIIDGDTSSNKNRWAISAGQQSSGKDTINFGVSLSGELYARLGTIGSWKITDKSLVSEKRDNKGDIISSITLDTEENKISFFNDSTVFWGDGRIFLGQSVGENGTVQGTVYLANYELSGVAADSITGLSTSLSLTPTETTINREDNSTDSGYGTVGYEGNTSIQTSVGETKKDSITVYKPNLFKIIDLSDNSNLAKTGVMIATGSAYEENPTHGRTVVFYPTGYDKSGNGKAILGTTEAPWNLIGNYIECRTLSVDNLNINEDALYIKGEKAATEVWVLNELNKIYAALNSVGSGSGSGIKGAFGGINNITSNLHKIFNGTRKWVNALMPSYDKDTGKLTIPYGTWTVTYAVGNAGNGASSNVNEAEFGVDSLNSVTLSGTTIPIGVGIDSVKAYVDKNDIKKIICTADNGEITISLTNLISEELASGSFNIADTQFYKDHAFNSFKLNVGGGSTGVGTSGSISALSISEKTLGTQTVGLSMYSSGINAIMQLQAGTTVLAQYSLKSFYESAYEEGHGVGYSIGHEEGHSEGYSLGHGEGYTLGHSEGYTLGQSTATCTRWHVASVDHVSVANGFATLYIGETGVATVPVR